MHYVSRYNGTHACSSYVCMYACLYGCVDVYIVKSLGNVSALTNFQPSSFRLVSDSENRSICINELRNIVSNLHTEDYVRFSDDILGTRCDVNDTLCEDRRLVVIDVISRLGDETSQELLIRHVLSKETAVGEELRRVFVHCVAMEKPTEVRICV